MTSGHAQIAIYFASHDGQTGKIAGRLAEYLEARGVHATLTELKAGQPSAIDDSADLVVLAAAIRYGVHLPAARSFLVRLRTKVPENRIAIVSVNLTARKPGRQSLDGNVYLRNWMRRSGLRPALAKAIAGRLDYPAYRWFDRLMIRAIMTISGGPTDPDTVIEYTDWKEVENLSQELTNLVMTTP